MLVETQRAHRVIWFSTWLKSGTTSFDVVVVGFFNLGRIVF